MVVRTRMRSRDKSKGAKPRTRYDMKTSKTLGTPALFDRDFDGEGGFQSLIPNSARKSLKYFSTGNPTVCELMVARGILRKVHSCVV